MSDQTSTPVAEETDPELEQATQELSNLSPAEYLELLKHIKGLEAENRIPEAPAFAWTTMRLNGAEVSLGVRTHELSDALSKLAEGVKFAKLVGYTENVPQSSVVTSIPAPVQAAMPLGIPQQPQPVYEQDGAEIIMVEAFTIKTTLKDARKYVAVKGGKFTKYGVPAYQEIMNTIPGFDIEAYPIGPDYTLDPSNPVLAKMRFAKVRIGKQNKVLQFSETPNGF